MLQEPKTPQKILIFQEMETLKKPLMFQDVTCNARKTNKKVYFEAISCIL